MFDGAPPKNFEPHESISADAVVMLDQAICLTAHASSECMGQPRGTFDGPSHFFLIHSLLEAALRTLRSVHPKTCPQSCSAPKIGPAIPLARAIGLLEHASYQALHHPTICKAQGQQTLWAIHCIIEGALMEAREAQAELEDDPAEAQTPCQLREVCHV
ncbi:MAG: hypothetical protein RR101_15075 [Burkholderiaceae bacterium]